MTFMRFIALVLCTYALSFGPAKAQGISQLTQSNINAFFNDMQTVMSDPNFSLANATLFLQQHLVDDGVFRGNNTTIIPDVPNRTETLDVGKDEYIDLFVAGRTQMANTQTAVIVGTTQITAADRALVQIRINEDADLRTLSQTGPVDIDSSTTSLCNTELVLNGGFIQMRQASCTTTTTITP